MKFRIIHELPDRLRIKLFIPGGYSFDLDKFKGIEGIKHISFNYRTASLLIRHNGDSTVKDEALKAIAVTPLRLFRKKAVNTNSIDEKKKAVMASGARLIVSSLFPLPMRAAIAIYGAAPFFKKAIKALLNRRLNIDVLDATAIGAAMGIGDYRTAGVISLLLKVGDYLEEWTRDKSTKMLAGAFQISDEYVWVRNKGTEYMVKTSELKEGDIVVVRTGSRIPVDGVVVEGEAMVNQSSMTGEPLPVAKRQGISVYAGTVVEEGLLAIEAQKVGSETTVSKIVSIIEESSHLKAEVQSHAERLADRLVPYIFLLSGITYLTTGNMTRAASVLLVDYSCAIKLFTPLAIMAGMINSAKNAVVIKGGRFIESLAKADVFVLDKTGTLTEASPKVVDVVAFNGYSKDYVLKHAACVEEHFPHPVATAVVKKAKDEGLIHKEEHSGVEYIASHGIASYLNGKRIIVGSRHFVIEDEGIDDSCCTHIISKALDTGHSILYVAIDNKLAGLIVIEDPLRCEAPEFIKRLRDSGVKKILMLTGDADPAARNIADRLGIAEYYSHILPDKKAEIVKWLKNTGHIVAMVGDGINDSLALSHAHVGISMRHGADIAKESCDVLLLEGSLMSIIKAKDMSKKVLNVIKQNFRYTVGINSSLIILSLTGTITPAFSAFMHNAVTITTALNSMRIISYRNNTLQTNRREYDS